MKTIVLSIATLLFAANIQAQNKNVTRQSNTTVTTVKDSDGEKKLVRTQNVSETQNVELQNADSNALNKDIKASPVQVTSSTVVTTPDGTTRVVDVDRSAYYSLGGKTYQMSMDNSGYTMLGDNNKKEGLIRKLSNDTYLYRSGDKTSVGYFDGNGNFVLQTYDDSNDRIITETYMRNR